MEVKQPTLAELIEALPAGLDEGPAAGAPREQLDAMLRELAGRPVPAGRARRLWSLGTLQARVAAAYLAWWLRSGFQSEERKRQGLDEVHLSAALLALGRMSYLRGAVMKVGQTLANWPHVLPTQFAQILGKLEAEAPPMHFALLREQFRAELGGDPSEVFDDFEPEAFAAASLGQVHRARLKGSGRPVAVKIQYPDIDRTIGLDMSSLRAAAFGMRLSGDWENLNRQYDGIQAMLEQETDYLREAELARAARECLAGMDDVVVPEVFGDLSTRRVLTMELIDGPHLEPFLASHPDQARRDRHGAQIARATSRLWYSGRTVYADPHPGNFLFLPDGRLGLIDFGCCHRFTDEEYDYVMEVERAAGSNDQGAVDAILAYGCDLAPDQLTGERREMMRRYTEWLWEPMRADGDYDFSDPECFQRGARLYATFVKKGWVRSQPVNVWLTRVFYGVRAMLTRLGARVPYGRILREEARRAS